MNFSISLIKLKSTRIDYWWSARSLQDFLSMVYHYYYTKAMIHSVKIPFYMEPSLSHTNKNDSILKAATTTLRYKIGLIVQSLLTYEVCLCHRGWRHTENLLLEVNYFALLWDEEWSKEMKAHIVQQIVHHELSILFWYFINTMGQPLGPLRAFISFYYLKSSMDEG